MGMNQHEEQVLAEGMAKAKAVFAEEERERLNILQARADKSRKQISDYFDFRRNIQLGGVENPRPSTTGARGVPEEKLQNNPPPRRTLDEPKLESQADLLRKWNQ